VEGTSQLGQMVAHGTLVLLVDDFVVQPCIVTQRMLHDLLGEMT
jgi:hypothetical protein